MAQGRRVNPFLLVVIAFLGVMFLGAILLGQNWASSSGLKTDFIDALFTSASALFVTGLAVLETGTHWSFWGQLIILLLIQTGALGVVTIGGYIAYLLGQRFYYADRMLIGDNLGFGNKGEAIKVLKLVVRYVFLIELFGALLLTFNFLFHGFDLTQALWHGVFHAVSAFANAGFDVFALGTSAQTLLEIGFALEIVMLLIVLGGLGFPVWLDVLEKIKKRSAHQISFHSRIVLLMNIALIVLGTLAFCFLERENRLPLVGQAQHLRESIFHSVSARTAGFSVYDLSTMSKPSLVVLMSLMFVGGSPASTAGGIKVTVALVLALMLWGTIRGDLSLQVMKKKISLKTAFRGLSLAVISALLIVFSLIALEVFDNPPFLSALFESVSAMGTVGLSLGLTGNLSVLSKLALILLMFMGRVGLYVLLYGLIFYAKRHNVIKKYPKADICL